MDLLAIARQADGIDAIIDLNRADDKAVGSLAYLNIVTSDKILEAAKDPDRFPDLVARVTGSRDSLISSLRINGSRSWR